jgi:hypothetical protein
MTIERPPVIDRFLALLAEREIPYTDDGKVHSCYRPDPPKGAQSRWFADPGSRTGLFSQQPANRMHLTSDRTDHDRIGASPVMRGVQRTWKRCIRNRRST